MNESHPMCCWLRNGQLFMDSSRACKFIIFGFIITINEHMYNKYSVHRPVLCIPENEMQITTEQTHRPSLESLSEYALRHLVNNNMREAHG